MSANIITASTAAEDSNVISTARATLLEVQVINTSASERYLQLFNATSLPADTAVPVWRGVVGAGQQLSLSFATGDRYAREGIEFDTGIVAALSSTSVLLTVTTSDEGLFQAIKKS